MNHSGRVWCTSWLGRRFLKITFSKQEDDPIVDVEKIRELLDEKITFNRDNDLDVVYNTYMPKDYSIEYAHIYTD